MIKENRLSDLTTDEKELVISRRAVAECMPPEVRDAFNKLDLDDLMTVYRVILRLRDPETREAARAEIINIIEELKNNG